MASENIEFILKLKDEMSKGLNEINNKLDGLQQNAKKTSTAFDFFKGGLMVKGFEAAMDGVKWFTSGALAAYDKQEKAVAQVNQGLLSTGHSAGLALKELTDEASKLQSKTIFGDESILQDVTAQFLTFSNIQGDVFKRGQGLALDLATRLDGDLKGSAIQLGKALDNPIQGINALSRSGVSFTETEKDTIKALVESGNIVKAQTMILNSLETQYGGSAEAARNAGLGGFQAFQNSLGDIQEELGKKLMPIINQGVNLLNDKFLPAISFLVDNFGTLAKIAGVAAGAFAIYKIATIASTLSTISFSGAFAALNAVIAANPIGAVLVGLTALGALFVWLWDKSEGFRSTLYGVWEVLKNIGSNIGDIFGDGLINGLITIGKKIYDFLLTPFYELLSLVDKIAGTDYSKSLKSMLATKSIFEGSGDAYAKGVKKGLASFEKKEGLTISKEGLMTGQTSTKTTSTTKGSKTLSNEVAKVQSRQPSNVYINIDAIIKGDVNNMINNANNPKQDLNNFLVQLENALLSVVNDVNLVTK